MSSSNSAENLKHAREIVNVLADSSVPDDNGNRKQALQRVLGLARASGRADEQVALLQLVLPWLDEVVSEVVSAISSLPVPAAGSPAETALQAAMRQQFLPRLWELPGKMDSFVCEVTRTCIGSLQSRFLGADTFEFGDFVHTSQWLGKGTEGVVHLGFQISKNGRRVAIKRIERAMIEQHHWEEALNKGCEFLLKADHPSVVKLYHVERLESYWYVYMEYIDGGDLRSFLCKQDPLRKEPPMKVVLSEAKAKEVFRKLVEPVDYLRRMEVIHRDLKPANFMLSRNGDVKLVDFATMRSEVETGGLAQSVKGTPAYMAPEIWMSSKQKYDGEKVDVWSMGVILYEMVCGAMPWVGEDVQSLYRNQHKKPLHIPPSLGLSKELCDLLVNTLKVNAQFRMTWVEVVGHAWLAEDPLAGMGNFLEENVHRLQLEVEQMAVKLQSAERKEALKDATIAALSKELKQQQDEAAAETRLQIERVRREAAAAQHEAVQAAVANHEIETAAVIQRDAAEAKQMREAKDAQLAALRGELEKTTALLMAAHAREGEQTQEAHATRRELQAAAAREAQLKEKFLATAKNLTELQERLDKSTRTQEASNAEVLQLRQSQAQLFAAQQKCNEMQERLDKALRENAEVSQLRQSQAQLFAAQQKCNELQERLDKALRENAEVSQLRQSQAQLFSIQQKCAAAEKSAADSGAALKIALAQVSSLRAELASAVAERDHVRVTMEDVLGNLSRSAEGPDLRAHIETLEAELREVRADAERKEHNLMHDLAASQAQVTNLKEEVATMRFLVDESNKF